MLRKLLAFLGELILSTHQDDRKDTDMKLPSIRRRSTDSIVGPLAKIVKNLETHAARQAQASDNKADHATRLLQEVRDHDAEAGRALAARDKIAALIG